MSLLIFFVARVTILLYQTGLKCYSCITWHEWFVWARKSLTRILPLKVSLIPAEQPVKHFLQKKENNINPVGQLTVYIMCASTRKKNTAYLKYIKVISLKNDAACLFYNILMMNFVYLPIDHMNKSNYFCQQKTPMTSFPVHLRKK